MPNINLQYLLSVCLMDGQLTPESTHSLERMNDPDVMDLRKRVALKVDPGLLKIVQTERQAVVEVATKGGVKYREHVLSVRGTKDNPMTTAEVEKKCSELMNPVLGKERTPKLIGRIRKLEEVKDIRELRPLLSA